jgi:putative drug exporter of the RND superfamily
LARLARWCFRHRLVVIAVWIVVFASVVGFHQVFGSAYSDSFNLPGTESSQALQVLTNAMPLAAGESGTIVWHTSSGSINDSAVKDRVSATLAQIAKSPSVAMVIGPYDSLGAGQVSQDGRTGFATVAFAGSGDSLPKQNVIRVIDLAKGASTNGLQVEVGGDAAEAANHVSLSSSAIIGLVAAGAIILLAFGSLFGMLLPLLTAGVALGLTMFGIDLLSHGVAINSVAPTMAIVVGLGVGVDYALFIVTRYRQGVKSGSTPEEAAVRSLSTAGRAVLFAGATVCIALLGLLVLRVNLLSGLAYSSVFAVLLTMVASITLLPALLGFMGTRVLSRRERRRLAAHGPEEGHFRGFWARLGHFVSRRPGILAVCTVLIMVVLASPFLNLRLGLADAGNDPAATTSRKAYDMLTQAFGPGFNGPLILVAEGSGSAADSAALDRLAKDLAAQPGVAAAQPAQALPGSNVSIIQVIPTTSPQDAQTSALIKHLRTDVIPPAVAGSGLHVLVGGGTAVNDDFAAMISHKLPLFVGVIVALGFLLLFVAFRSFVVPATAAIMNLLAAAASFGVVVAFFQWGWGSELLGLGRAGPVEAFLPVLMLAVLFGLSMDYQVFLVSRMHEEWVNTGDNRRAVITGQAATGRVITAAAAIMICVFAAFIFGGQRVVAEFGVGLATAVFLDAFLLRTFLVPALMHLFGKANWHLPRVIERYLPRLSVEPASAAKRPMGGPKRAVPGTGTGA